MSVIWVTPPLGSKMCSWRKRAKGPRTISSTKRHGASKSVILEVIRQVSPKWRASQDTSCPGPIRPEVTPATARSREATIDSRWRSMLRDRSKHRSAGAAISVPIVSCGMSALRGPALVLCQPQRGARSSRSTAIRSSPSLGCTDNRRWPRSPEVPLPRTSWRAPTVVAVGPALEVKPSDDPAPGPSYRRYPGGLLEYVIENARIAVAASFDSLPQPYGGVPAGCEPAPRGCVGEALE